MTPSKYLKPHLRDVTPEERHLIQKGFLLGIEYTKMEIDEFIKKHSPVAH